MRLGSANSNQFLLGGVKYHQKIVSSPATVFIGDLPKDVSQVELYDYLQRQVGGEFELVLKR